jgi:hypothetical protein
MDSLRFFTHILARYSASREDVLMKLLYTLRYGASSGNCGGDLRLFFTTQNPADWKPSPPAPPPGLWIPPQNTAETLTLPSGDVVEFSLMVLNNGTPGELYLYGPLYVTTKAGLRVGSPIPIGQAAPVQYAPNLPVVGFLKGRNQGSASGITWDIGFELAVPWDGTSADCAGQWWAIWH